MNFSHDEHLIKQYKSEYCINMKAEKSIIAMIAQTFEYFNDGTLYSLFRPAFETAFFVENDSENRIFIENPLSILNR